MPVPSGRTPEMSVPGAPTRVGRGGRVGRGAGRPWSASFRGRNRATRRIARTVATPPGPAGSTHRCGTCQSALVHIGVLGATGPAGQAVAVQLAHAGVDVSVG